MVISYFAGKNYWPGKKPVNFVNHHSLSFDYITKTDSVLSILDIVWNSKRDVLKYRLSQPTGKLITKWVVVSKMAKIFDPFGLLGPVVFIADLIIQRCLKHGVEWDESLPQDLYYE